MKNTKNKKVRYIFFISLFIAVSFICVSAGHFLFDSENDKVPMPSENTLQAEPIESTSALQMNPVKYVHRSETVNGLKQEINILEIDPGASGLRIQPTLSHDLIYGFEKLSEMAERKNAYAAVNGGFFHEYGLPSGMVVIDGELVSASTGRYPVFVVEEGKAALKEIESKLTVEYGSSSDGINAGIGSSNAGIGSTADGDAARNSISSCGSSGEIKENRSGAIMVDGLNFPAGAKETAVYTPVYGKYNRAEKKNITATIKNGIVTKVAFYIGEVEIPPDGMLVSFFDTEKYAGVETPLRVGDAIRLLHKPEMGENLDAYECGSWLVRDGKSVVAEKDAWVGIMTNRDPRTAVGIRDDGTVLLITVDGRQPGYSAGFTGKELAEYLISCGAKEAAMLDGGASTEMIVEGKLVSRPSYKSEERPLGGGILVLLEE